MTPPLTRSPSLPTKEEVRLAAESSRKLAAIIGHGETARLCLHDGDDQVTVPIAAIRLLADILNQMAQGNAVFMIPVAHTLTTQQAADLLNVSRPYFVRLLEKGEIPYAKVGRHRRVQYQDLLDYMKQIDKESKEAANELTKQAQTLRMGY